MAVDIIPQLPTEILRKQSDDDIVQHEDIDIEFEE